MTTDELKEYLRDNLRIEVKTTSEYTGHMDSGEMYRDRRTIELTLDGEIISEITL